jgi:hypothetical protein
MKVYSALEVAQLEWFTNAGKPSAASNIYRVIWVSDFKRVEVSDGTQWVPVGSGGGGGSLQWEEDALSPIPSLQNNIKVYSFEAAMTQYLYAFIKVPSSYTPGNQVTLKLTFYSPGTSGNALIQTLSTLIRTGTDAVTSTTNQRTSTNSAVTLSGATQDIPQAVTFDLSSTTGQINSVSLAAGDLVLVRLTRGTDTATDPVYVPVYAAEVSFG